MRQPHNHKPPMAFIQYKGTELCADFHCKCGVRGHLDGDFIYFVRCKSCGTSYEVGSFVRLYELTSDEVVDACARHRRFVVFGDEDEGGE